MWVWSIYTDILAHITETEFLTNRCMHIKPMHCVYGEQKKHIHDTLKYVSSVNITTHYMCMHCDYVITHRSLTLALEG